MSRNDEKRVAPEILGKATFIDFNSYAEWCLTEEADEFFSIHNMWAGYMSSLQGTVPGINFSKLYDMCKTDDWYKKNSGEILRDKYYLKPLTKCLEYMETFSSEDASLKFDLIYEYKDIFDVIAFGKYQFIVPVWAINKEHFEDYTDVALSELRAKALMGDKAGIVPVGSQLATMSQLAVKEQISEAEALQLEYNAEKSDIENARVEGLEALQREIEEKQAELEAKKQELLEVFYKKQALLEEKMKQLKSELYVLESEIYSIRCFLGEVVDFIKLRSGNPAPVDAPITLFQKMRFLDDELGKLVSVYDFDFGDVKLFEKLLQSRDDILDVFCPNDKCVSLVRVSKTGTYFGYDDVGELLAEYEVYHGLRIGILIRNGENLYMGWTDESKINIPDDMFYAPGTKFVSNSEDAGETTSIEEAVSRYFIFSILQGALQNKQMLTLPEGVKADFSKPSEYIIYSVADTWLCDNRYGTFDEMIDKCNSKITVGDYVLSLEWNNDKDGYRGHSSYRNLTRGLSVRDRGIYPIRLIEENNDKYSFGDYRYYVSLQKNYDDEYVWRGSNLYERKRDAYALFQIYEDEFINLTYMNSTWLKYVITTKNLGTKKYRLSNFAEAIRYLNDALKFIKEREKEEAKYIGQYVDNITEDTWVQVTEFKLEKGVRNINDYQAKRFAKWLANNQINSK